MSDEELIRSIFDRIKDTPDAECPALRAKIVRAVRGELLRDFTEDVMIEGKESLEKRLIEGRSSLARKRVEAAQIRVEKYEAMLNAVKQHVPEDLWDHIRRLVEEPNANDYTVSIQPPAFAPILARFGFWSDGWHRESWAGRDGRLWAVVPWPNADAMHWLYSDELNEALAIAEMHGVAHLPMPKPRGWWDRLATWVGLRLGCGWLTLE